MRIVRQWRCKRSNNVTTNLEPHHALFQKKSLVDASRQGDLLLARLGLRGDVSNMGLDDVSWEEGTLRVCGKGRQTVELPLPQSAWWKVQKL